MLSTISICLNPYYTGSNPVSNKGYFIGQSKLGLNPYYTGSNPVRVKKDQEGNVSVS